MITCILRLNFQALQIAESEKIIYHLRVQKEMFSFPLCFLFVDILCQLNVNLEVCPFCHYNCIHDKLYPKEPKENLDMDLILRHLAWSEDIWWNSWRRFQIKIHIGRFIMCSKWNRLILPWFIWRWNFIFGQSLSSLNVTSKGIPHGSDVVTRVSYLDISPSFS